MMATPYIEFIPKAGACLATTNVIEGRGRVRWMVRRPSKAPADNGWQIMSHIDTSEYLNDSSNWQIVDFNELCAIEPALIGIWDLPVGSDLQLVDDELGIRIVDTATGREVPRESLYVPPQHRAEPSAPAAGTGGDDQPDARQQHLIDVGIAHWRKMVPEDAPLGYRLLPEDDAVAVFHMVRGGGTLYIASDESVLFAASSVSPDQALEVFRSGRRSDTSKFRPAGS